MRGGRRSFSLLEVVVAIGVFALGIIVVIGLFAPLTRSIGANADAEAAVGIADALKVEFAQRVRRAASFAPILALLEDTNAPDGTSAGSNPDTQRLFASRDGLKIGEYSSDIWTGAESARFFEIELVRVDLFPIGSEAATAITLTYTAKVRWPAGAAEPQTLLVNGSLRR